MFDEMLSGPLKVRAVKTFHNSGPRLEEQDDSIVVSAFYDSDETNCEIQVEPIMNHHKMVSWSIKYCDEFIGRSNQSDTFSSKIRNVNLCLENVDIHIFHPTIYMSYKYILDGGSSYTMKVEIDVSKTT